MHSASIIKLLPVANKEMWSCSVDNTVKIWSVDGQYVADARTQDQVYCMIEVPGPRGDTKVGSPILFLFSSPLTADISSRNL